VRRRRKQIVMVLLLLVVLSFLLLLIDTLGHEKGKKIYNISLITTGKNSESLMIMKQGIDQSASEMNVNISFVTLSEDNNYVEQSELIAREIKNKADAIIISPVDYEKMAEPIENAMKKIPVILIESTVNSKYTLPSISCDNYELGVSLAEEMVKNGKVDSNIAIVKNNLECSSVKERYDGFMSVMQNTQNNCIFWDIKGEKSAEYYTEARKMLEWSNADAVVTFNSDMLEGFAQAKKDVSNFNKEKSSVEIYGVGSTSRIISFLEEKIINATAIQNEFNIGYLAVKTAIYKLDNKNIDNSNISSTVINTKNMYSEENQKLLFPFVR
jgi:ribose transport system substrate-binding protein